MNSHIVSVHGGEKPLKCDYCFSLKSNLNRQIASVHEEKRHSNETFVTTALLKMLKLNHISSVHVGMKPLKYIHVASVYKNKKPFKCNICDYTCSEKYI